MPDVFVVHSGRASSKPGADGKSLYIFDGALLANGAGAAAHRVSSGATQVGDAFPGTNGTVLYADPHAFIGGTRAVGDWDGWLVDGNPTSDIVQGLSSIQGLVIRANQQVGGASINLGMFPYGQSEQANPNNPTAPYGYGAAVDGGADMTGDGLVDFVVATAAGELYVYY